MDLAGFCLLPQLKLGVNIVFFHSKAELSMELKIGTVLAVKIGTIIKHVTLSDSAKLNCIEA